MKPVLVAGAGLAVLTVALIAEQLVGNGLMLAILIAGLAVAALPRLRHEWHEHHTPRTH